MYFLAALVSPLLLVGGVAPPGVAPVARVQAMALVVGLDITVPPTASLGAGLAGTTLSRSLGTVTVADTRTTNPNTWTATVSATAFITGGGGPAQTIATTQVSYWSGPVTKQNGGGTKVPGQATAAQAVTLTVPRIAFSKTTGNQRNSVSWAPTLRVAIPAGAVTGVYSGTITHSVA
ncbi:MULTISPECIES: hypothetical protein [unclassified Micromonospora]|uniref:hypothetical protein n=1 Tax=unclassified Micromonospora TaxID=2617518 RepID=UPI001C5EA5CF|nr:hypothetical protein [Micromonospora sp. RL09-050-HVF-A]MBW4701718.1 hypothetical protein [Micromonospora sp. RL09-050-HVF-A]